MTDSFDPRAAGRSLRDAHAYLLESFANIGRLLRTADAQFAESTPAWISDDGNTVTWENSAALYDPARWAPRYFRRLWRRDDGSDERWHHAAALDIRFDAAATGASEPWVGCYLFECGSEHGSETWDHGWFQALAFGEENLCARRWASETLRKRAFTWSEIREKDKNLRVCGFYLRLTDIRTSEDLARNVVTPLIALRDGWSEEKLPELVAAGAD